MQKIGGEVVTLSERILADETLSGRFWRKVEIVLAPDACCPWKGSIAKWNGYGRIKVGGKDGHAVGAHIVAWVLRHGAIPAGLEVRHKCGNARCVNYNHLELGTHLDNMRDRDEHGRTASVANGRWRGRAKLTSETVRAVRQRRESGESMGAIARSLGVSVPTVKDIVHRRTWSHVE